MCKKQLAFIAIMILLGISCASREEIVISMGEITITKSEFEKEFKKFNLSKLDTEETRKEFLKSLINRKLILREAEEKKLDKDPAFLEAVQDFWEQALLKLSADKKSRELFITIKVDDSEIVNFYNANKDRFAGKTLDEAYPEIRLDIFKEKQNKAVLEWMDALKKKANIKINYKALGIEEMKRN